MKHLAGSLCPVFVSMRVWLQPKKLFACRCDLLMYFTKLSSLLLIQCINIFRKHLSDQFFGRDFLKINSDNSVSMADIFYQKLKGIVQRCGKHLHLLSCWEEWLLHICLLNVKLQSASCWAYNRGWKKRKKWQIHLPAPLSLANFPHSFALCKNRSMKMTVSLYLVLRSDNNDNLLV